MKRLMTVLMILLVPATASPEVARVASQTALSFFSAQHLHSLLRCNDVRCSSDEEVRDWNIGYGYVLGVHDAYSGSSVCPPDSAKAGQIVTVVKRFLDANPGVWHLSADVLVARALHQQWPCELPVEGESNRRNQGH